MVRKLNVWLFVTILFIIEVSGFKLSDLELLDDFVDDSDSESDSIIDESDYWDLVNTLNEINPLFGDDVHVPDDDEKWNEIDNLQWIDSCEDNGFEILQMRQTFEVAGQGQYTLGKRANGDRVVGIDARNLTYSRMQDIRANMTYPRAGIGRNLTYVTIDVNQTSNLGQAYVVRGGIGKNFIAIIVEAYKTLYFNYRATFYGI